MIVRMVAFEGLQPMIAEAFLKEQGSIQCEGMKDSNESWEFLIVMIIAINNIGFAAVIVVLFELYKHFEISDIQHDGNCLFKVRSSRIQN